MRLSGRTITLLAADLAVVIVWSSDQIMPATSQYQAQMRIWLVARASGIVAYLLLTFVVAVGLVLSHPINKSTWKLSKQIFPWHENLFIFVVAFVGAHVVSLILDPYAGVGVLGAFVPGLSSFRTVPVALGTIALYAYLITGLTARYTKLLPTGAWLRLHRFSILVWAVTWVHGILAGTDSGRAGLLYVVSGAAVVLAAAYRYWVGKQGRPTFATSLPAEHGSPARGRGPSGAATAPEALSAPVAATQAAPAPRIPSALVRPDGSTR
jgi:hypothetical protein